MIKILWLIDDHPTCMLWPLFAFSALIQVKKEVVNAKVRGNTRLGLGLGLEVIFTTLTARTATNTNINC